MATELSLGFGRDIFKFVPEQIKNRLFPPVSKESPYTSAFHGHERLLRDLRDHGIFPNAPICSPTNCNIITVPTESGPVVIYPGERAFVRPSRLILKPL